MERPAILGIAGGIVDLAAGADIIATSWSMEPTGTMMGPPASAWPGFLLVAFGVIVLATGVYALFASAMMRTFALGRLMIAYGTVMLAVAFAMFARLLFVMDASLLSGTAMTVIGVAMIYSGSRMAWRRTNTTTG